MSNEELVFLIQKGQDISKNMLQLWQQNRRFISMIAQKYIGHAEQDDLEQEGYLALNHAVECYNVDMDIPFINYAAQWLHQGMRRYIENCGSVVRIPVHEQQKQREYKKAVNTFKIYCGRKPTKEEIAYYMGLSVERIEAIEKSLRMKSLGSLDSPLDDEEGECTVGDMISSTEDIEDDVLSRVEQEELRETLWTVVDTLPDRQAQVLRMRYQQGKTLKEIGASFGVRYQYVYELEYKAMREMRKSHRAKRLAPFLPEDLGSTAYNCSGAGRFKHTFTSSTELAALMLLEDF